MSREARSIFLVVLTFVIYATTEKLKENGAFIFPFPLNPFFFAAVAFYFSYLHRNKREALIIVMPVAVFGVLSSKIFWEVILSIDQLGSFLNYPWIYWFHLFYGIAITIWGAYVVFKQNDSLARLLSAIGVLLFAVGYAIGNELLVLSGFGFLAVTTLAKPVLYPFNLLWVLLFLLEGTKWINYLLH